MGFFASLRNGEKWDGNDKQELVRGMFRLGLDSHEGGARTRVNSILRIITERMDQRALEEIRDSASVNRKHPDAHDKAENLLQKYF